MSALRLAIYVFGLAAVMTGLVAIERFTETGLRLLVPSPLARTLGTSEYSPVEWLQVITLVVIAAMAWHCTTLHRAQRTLAWMMVAVAAAAACRELDLFLDGYLFDHAWQLVVAVIAVAAIVHAMRHRNALIAAWRRALPEPGLVLMVFGVALLVVFANVIGNEGLWQSLLGDGYRRIAKIAAEEFAELAGYWLWFVGQAEYMIACRRQQRLAGESRERRRRERRRGGGR